MGTFEFDRFFAVLKEELTEYCKDGYYPSGIFIDALVNHTEDCTDDFVTDEILPRMGQYNMTLLELETEDYLPAGSSKEQICMKMLDMIKQAGQSADTLYYEGMDVIPQKYPELYLQLSNMVFFAVAESRPGINCIQITSNMLREALQYHHVTTTGQEEEYWIDEETLEFFKPYVKNQHIPHWVIDKAQRLLMIRYGDPPLCENVLIETVKAAKLQTVLVNKEHWISGGVSRDIVRMKLLELLRANEVSLDECYQKGLEAIHPDILQLACGMVFFASDEVQSLHDAGVLTGQLLTELIGEERVRFHPEEDVIRVEADETMATELRVYAKNGYVPSWVLTEQFNRLLKEKESMTVTAAIRDATLEQLGFQVLLLEKEYYYTGENATDEDDDVYTELFARLDEWDMERVCEAEGVPPEYEAAYKQFTAMIFFADDELETYEAAESTMAEALRMEMINIREDNGKDGISLEVRDELSDAVDYFQKGDYAPSWVRQGCVSLLKEKTACSDWYIDMYLDEYFSSRDIQLLDLPFDYRITDEDDDYRSLEEKVAELVDKLHFARGTFEREELAFAPEDERKASILIHAVFFADDDLDTVEEAVAKVARMLHP
ncbi:MAG: hypothetical protein IKK75_09175 [Clostridia bacterium]|nr:hypothetical protein [Clostridia bacterium]